VAFSQSGLYVHTFQEILRATTLTGGQIDLRLNTYKIALHNNSLTQGTSPLDYSAVDTTWVNTQEVSGTNWAAGGPTILTATGGSPTLAEGTPGSIRYDMPDVSVASTTLNTGGGPRGCIIHAFPVSAPADMADAMIIAITFGNDYPTTNGTFAIQWSATGVAEIDLTP
jgi:hypothetical protein